MQSLSDYREAVNALERGEYPPFFDAIQPRGWASHARRDAALSLYKELRDAAWQPWVRSEVAALRSRLAAIVA